MAICSVFSRLLRIHNEVFIVMFPRMQGVLLHLAWRDGFVHYSDAHIDDLSKHYRFMRVVSSG